MATARSPEATLTGRKCDVRMQKAEQPGHKRHVLTQVQRSKPTQKQWYQFRLCCGRNKGFAPRVLRIQPNKHHYARDHGVSYSHPAYQTGLPLSLRDVATPPVSRATDQHNPDTYPHTSCSDDRHVLYFTQLSTGATVNGRDIAGSLDIAPLKFSTGLPIRKEAFPSITPTPIPMSLASASPQQKIDGQKPGKLPMMCWTALQWGRLFHDKMDCQRSLAKEPAVACCACIKMPP